MELARELENLTEYRSLRRLSVANLISDYQEGELVLGPRTVGGDRSRFIENILCGRPQYLFLSVVKKHQKLMVVENTDEIAAMFAFIGCLTADDCEQFKTHNGWSLIGGERLSLDGVNFASLPEEVTAKYGRLMRYSFDVFERGK